MRSSKCGRGNKVGVRLSPRDAPNGGNTYYGANDSNPDFVYRHTVPTLDRRDLAYLLLTEPRWVGKHDNNPETNPGFQMPLRNLITFWKDYDGIMIRACCFTPAMSYTAMNDNDTAPANNGNSSGYDALAFGRWFISNPNLPVRLKSFHELKAKGSDSSSQSPPPPLNRYERDIFYSQEAEDYIDYPSLEFEHFCKLGSPAGSEKPEYQGMELRKNTLLEQDVNGSSLKAMETRPMSKL